jgi:GNAT superfamily N-acetyltransferase
MSQAALQWQLLRGSKIAGALDELAALRVAVFREWPYLYDGDAAYERDYLATYVRCPDSLVVLACAGGRAIGASTGLPLAAAEPAMQRAFDGSDIDPARVFYFGESVLLPGHRGRGLGHRFFDLREAHARELGACDWTAFCAVDRAPDDPRRPPGAFDKTGFWTRRGYRPHPQLVCRFPWREIGDPAESEHVLKFWLRPLAPVQEPAA